jgi:hypothetical protein
LSKSSRIAQPSSSAPAFFYNVSDASGERYGLYTLSDAPREAFANFGLPRNTEVFDATFRGTGVVRSDDIRKDPRYGKIAASLRCRGHFRRHVVWVDQVLAVKVPALLWQQLVFEVHGAGTRLLEGADHVHDVERLAVAGVPRYSLRLGGDAQLDRQ